MVLYMIGLGLGSPDDITVHGLRIVQRADWIFVESYTSVFFETTTATAAAAATATATTRTTAITALKEGEQQQQHQHQQAPLAEDNDEQESSKIAVPALAHLPTIIATAYNLPRQDHIVVADRDLVEQQAEARILHPARDQTVAFLVVGDPVCATTHTDLWLRARKANIPVQIIHNASIMGAAGACGLQLYQFGHTVSIPFFEDHWKPTSFYSKILYNRRGGMHTLCLLDIKVKEPDYDALIQSGGKRKTYLPPRFMTIAIAAEQLLYAEQQHEQHAYHGERTLCVGLARMGHPTEQCICAGTLQELIAHDFGGPLHSLIICGQLHEMELEVLNEFLVEGSNFDMGQHQIPSLVGQDNGLKSSVAS